MSLGTVDYKILRQAFIEWIDKVFYLSEVYWRYNNAPRSSDPYFTLFLQSFASIHRDYIEESIGLPTVWGDRELTLEVSIFKTLDGLSYLEHLNTSLKYADIRYHFANYGLVYVETQGMQDVTTLLDTRFESRAILDIRFRYSNQGTEPDVFETGLIEEVEDINYSFTN